jgi:O-acetyl-ADP-ribose deacetylase (regulator of RNase III)
VHFIKKLSGKLIFKSPFMHISLGITDIYYRYKTERNESLIYLERKSIFDSKAQVITNPVNCVGVMGAGLAKEFKFRYPSMFEDYKRRCSQGIVMPGLPYLWQENDAKILNFPTKRHWKDPSILADIDNGLLYIKENYAKLGISSLALPKLGCGLGGLDWKVVYPLILSSIGDLDGLEVTIHIV